MIYPDPFVGPVASARELQAMPADYQTAVAKVVLSHAVNEITGAQTFDEPSIRLAPTPFFKWTVSRVTMEEYGHHILFSRLADDLGLDWHTKKPLTLFDYPMGTWTQFGVVKAIVDLAEILQLEDLLECSYIPLRQLAVRTMPEERFHVGLGKKILEEQRRTAEGRAQLTDALGPLFQATLGFFGRAGSANNALYRRWGIKRRTNEAMRRDYVIRVKAYLSEMGMAVPPIPLEYAGEHLEDVS
ncbi:MAG: phenylacetate-CoA oxygenase subunit PaaI [Thermaerobacter sp.]|nr:phenylacetate-CoA oxygenase subunit PaaI [Thermaerobacter sp.]